MSLTRQLLVLIFSCFGSLCLIKAGFLTIQQSLIVPSTHPLLAQATTVPNAPVLVVSPNPATNFTRLIKLP